MTTTVAYVRVSTEDQVDYSPDAQVKRCRDLAQIKDLGAVTVYADEGWSGKNLDRPKMRELIAEIEAGRVGHLLVWRWDRLSRDQGDFSTLVKLFVARDVQVHSVNEGHLDLASASGKMQVGMQGVIAQYQRDQLIENTRMGQWQAHEQGRWINRAPTGYDMVNGYLIVNDVAPLVQRIFELRASGASYPVIANEVGMKYSTVRQVCLNRAYLGEVPLSGHWAPGIHTPLINAEQFNAAQRPHPQARRRGRDLLSGRVRCGNCGQADTVKYNERGQAIYKCRHRGHGCPQSGRAAQGLLRAAVHALKVLRDDQDLQAAIMAQLGDQRDEVGPRGPGIVASIAAIRNREKRLFELYVASKVDMEFFAEEQRTFRAQLATLGQQLEELGRTDARATEAVNQFDRLATLLRDFDLEAMWEQATLAERRILIQDLIDEVRIFPDLLTIQVAGAPPITVMPEEVGLRPGSRSVVSEARREPSLRR